MKKKLLFVLFALLPMVASADDSGSCGNGLTYFFEEETGSLTIYGNGTMKDCGLGSAPWYSYRDRILEAYINPGATSIGKCAFEDCSSLTSINIPNSVTSIGEFAFRECSSLTSITIPNSVTSIGRYTFYGCTSLKSITIPNSVTSIGEGAFSGCSGLTSVTIPNSVTSIGSGAFSGCSSLTSFTIPNSVTSIGKSAFSGCSSLTSINIPNSVTSIGESAFSGCTSLTSITIPNSVTSIGNYAFSRCSSLTSITIPKNVKSIGDYTFWKCSSLTSITIGSGVNKINSGAFCDCPELTDVYCYAVNVPQTNNEAFKDTQIEYATLHVPGESLQAYKETLPWSNFGTIVTISGKKCATPTISYDIDSKKLMFVCDTEDVDYVTEIKDADIRKFFDDRISLTATYEISVYATKGGYEKSDVATATLVWGSATFTDTTPATAIEMVPAMEAAMPVLIQNNGGMLTIQGAADGTPVSVYTTAGTEAGSAVSQNSMARISTSMQQGDIAIVRVGNRSVKVVIK